MKVFRAGCLLQEGIGSPSVRFLATYANRWKKVLEKVRKPPPDFQDVCLKTFRAVSAAKQAEDFNLEGFTYISNVLCAGAFIMRAGFTFPFFRLSSSYLGKTLNLGPEIVNLKLYLKAEGSAHAFSPFSGGSGSQVVVHLLLT